MLLMCDPNVERELTLIARKLVLKQRKGASITSTTPAPSLFVILPRTNNLNITKRTGLASLKASEDFYLYFLCDYGGYDADLHLRLHICEDSPSTALTITPPELEARGTTAADFDTRRKECCTGSPLHVGYRLRNLDNFLSKHAISMLSLLRALQTNPDTHLPSTIMTNQIDGGSIIEGVDVTSADNNKESSPGILSGRVRDAIRFLATRAYEALQDFQEHPSRREDDLAYYESAIPDLQWSDLWDEQEAMASTGARADIENQIREREFHRIPSCNDSDSSDSDSVHDKSALTLGGGVLCKTTNAGIVDGIRWLCQAHNEVICSAPAAERLSSFIKMHNGIYVPIEKSCNIRFLKREDAQAFYEVLAESRCLKKLRISLAWYAVDGIGVTEEDLWQLCEAVHTLNLQELSLDCGCDIPGLPHEKGHNVEGIAVSFKPILGMICRAGLEALTVENFDGEIFPGEASIQTQGEPDSFSLQQFRESESLVVPKNISLKQLALCHWRHYPDIAGLTAVVVICPNLTEIESLTESLEKLFFSIQNATVNLGSLLYFNINESDLEAVQLTIWRLECGRPAIRRVQRRGCKPLSPFIQSLLGLQNWTATRCIRIWEQPEAFHNVIHNNIGSLKSFDIACVTHHMVDFWPVLLHELLEAEAIAALTRGDSTAIDNRDKHVVGLRLNDLMGHCLESVSPQRLEQTSLVIRSYEDSFRPYLQPLSQFASILSIDAEFTNSHQLESLLEDVFEDGLWFPELAWFLTPETLNDPVFMAVLQELVRHPEVQTLTIRINGGEGTRRGGSALEPIQTLLQAWNDLTGMSLGWMEYGQWMQELSVQFVHPFRETLSLPTGAGELTFASEDPVVIGAPLQTRSAFPGTTWSSLSKASYRTNYLGSVIYALSCRCT
ncbi:hypothetical protein BGX26_003087 [Mortierella sp. AD094]|nr:hypothetical protein BGX26_003087 [Mortierella sp. AD094]